MILALLSIVRREVRLSLREGWQAATALLFFILVVMLLAFGIGPDPVLLRRVAPGALWTAALLSCLLSLDRLFAADHHDGMLDRLLASPVPAEGTALAKMLAHWLTTGPAADGFLPYRRTADRRPGHRNACHGGFACDWHAAADRRRRRHGGADHGVAARRADHRAADPALVRAGSDLRRRRAGQGAGGTRSRTPRCCSSQPCCASRCPLRRWVLRRPCANDARLKSRSPSATKPMRTRSSAG